MENKIDLSKVAYVLIMLYVLSISMIFSGCVKEEIPPVNVKVNSSVPLNELLVGNFHCYRVEYPNSNTYHFNSAVLLDLLGDWQTNPSAFNLNDDQIIDTQDLLSGLAGYESLPPDVPLEDYTPFDNFGEGNTWLTYTGDDPDIVFGWMHRTPYDETNDGNYVGYENIYTWHLDVVRLDSTVYYYFVSI